MKYITRNIYLKFLVLHLLFIFLGKLQPETLLNDCFCFVFPSVKASHKATKPVIENLTLYPPCNYIFKVDNSETKTGCGINSKLKVKAPDWRHLTLNRSYKLIRYFSYQLWTCNYMVSSFHYPYLFLYNDPLRNSDKLTYVKIQAFFVRLPTPQPILLFKKWPMRNG